MNFYVDYKFGAATNSRHETIMILNERFSQFLLEY